MTWRQQPVWRAFGHAANVWLDVRGRMRLDVKLVYDKQGAHIRVAVKKYAPSLPGTGTFWVPVKDILLPEPLGRHRTQILRTYADLASIQLGYPYRLRSKLR